MAKSKWVVTTEKTSGIIKGTLYFQEDGKWTTNKDVATTFSTKTKAQEICDSLGLECSVEKQ